MRAFALIFFLFCMASLHAGTRYALLIAKNNGGKSRPALRFAHNDARNMLAALGETGGLLPANASLVLEPDLKTLREKMAGFAHALSKNKPGAREVFIYYSGHSDERGLLIDNQVLPYAELKAWINNLPSDVNIVILDSCSSGSLSRVKGGRKIPSALISEAASHKGTAILASSSSSEDSQESDQLRGSFFTHNLIAGLRGAADLNRDNKVTLHEAYIYSYEETLANTLKSGAGPQHPYFDFKVQGQGDLTVADLNKNTSQLVLGESVTGTVYIFDSSNRLSLRLQKTSTGVMPLAIKPDRFLVRVIRDKAVLEHELTLKQGQRQRVDISAFNTVPLSAAEILRERYNSPFFFSAIAGPSFHFFMPGSGTLRNFDLADLGYTGRVMAGLRVRSDTVIYLTGAVSGISNLTKGGGNTSPIILNAGLGARYHFHPSGFYVGGSFNAAWNRISISQDFGRGIETLRYNSGVGFGIELSAGFEWKLGRDMGLGISWFSYFGAVYGGTSNDARLYADQVQNLVIGLMASFTYF